MGADRCMPPPADLGIAGSKFSDWRPGQDDAILRGASSPKRTVVHAAPTGMGKSLIGVAHHVLHGERTAFVTPNKSLQDQMETDFKSIGLVDIRGASNYVCLEHTQYMCDVAPCQTGTICRRMHYDCLYFTGRQKAIESSLALTNTSYWLYSNEYADGLGSRDLLILDEADSAPDHLLKFLTITISPKEMEAVGIGWPRHVPWEQWWRDCQRAAIKCLTRQLSRTQAKRYQDIIRKCKFLLQHRADSAGWVKTDYGRGGVTWQPLWPAEFAEQYLFRGIKKLVLTSATIRPKTLELLGLKPSEYEFIEHESDFPLSHRPIYYFDTNEPIRVDAKISAEDQGRLVKRIDDFIRPRRDRKGIVLTTSYQQARFIAAESRYSPMSHEPHNLEAELERFRKAPPPAAFVSPAIWRGVDLPGPECEYIVIAKVPFPDSRDPAMRARSKADKDYFNYLVMSQLVQGAGRGMRFPQDRCEVVIADEHAAWFIPRNRRHAPGYFLDALESIEVAPPPPPKL